MESVDPERLQDGCFHMRKSCDRLYQNRMDFRMLGTNICKNGFPVYTLFEKQKTVGEMMCPKTQNHHLIGCSGTSFVWDGLDV